jgi:sterol desaturase/sphingolipid hydroxylase (fatty acid hydroxylase superfamily)
MTVFSTPTRLALGAAAFASLLVAEGARPLRRPTQSKWRRVFINLIVGAVGGGALALVYGPVVLGVAERTRAAEFGLLRWVPLPGWAGSVLGVVLLDYTLWIWHWLNHRVPLLWRFHAAHHADLDLDASTAFRFHVGELLFSVPFRALQVAFIGVDVPALLLWEGVLLVATEFHHSNVRLPLTVDRALRRAIITPRMHGIHHSIVPGEVNSNFGTILSVWDRVHRTFLVGIPQSEIVIGLAELRDPSRLGLMHSLAVPFLKGLRPRPFGTALARGSRR